ncbi:oxidoreductase [uncultured Georgenia sp.]|uniref:oxidoreductase n=1 Tax=uncultured Georgenia sp. TaxID=378209 RepID=UPI002635C106|nr:oxidoreductase [uncultured Georgenia sp.]HLV05163.1 oxidoreductase [Actinomycetaceae bacterium]
MRLFPRRKKQGSSATPATSTSQRRAEVTAHFREFATTRAGVEAYVEPPTPNDPVTMVLVARTGEWTRRRVPDEKTAWALARELGIPVYDVNLTGYPSSMRRWSAAQRRR